MNQIKQKIKITSADQEWIAVMEDNPITQDFLSLLPLTLTLKDYSHTEKISDLPKKLSLYKAPSGYQPVEGDITLYAPWGNLAIFYKDFSYSPGLILLGSIESDMGALNSPAAVRVTIDLFS